MRNANVCLLDVLQTTEVFLVIYKLEVISTYEASFTPGLTKSLT